jgi:hypothetical protein
MNLPRLRQHLAASRVRIEFALPHALTEAFKDGLTVEELRTAVLTGEAIEDYGARSLLLAFTEPERIPYHVVLEYVPGEVVVTVVTTYIPDTTHWEPPDWKRRKKGRRQKL